MSRAHAVASLVGAKLPFREPGLSRTRTGLKPAQDHQPPNTTVYLDRAMLLWPRLDRTKLSRFADDPARWGNGDVEVVLNTLDDLPYVMGLVQQSFERQMGEGGAE